MIIDFFFIWLNSPQLARASSFTRFLDHTQRRTTVGRSPLDEWSARRRDLYLTTKTHNRQTFMSPVGLKPTVSAVERPQTYAINREATGTDTAFLPCFKILYGWQDGGRIRSKNVAVCKWKVGEFDGLLTHWNTQPAVRRAEPSMTLLLILAFCR
jgi:hypothetical protein